MSTNNVTTELKRNLSAHTSGQIMVGNGTDLVSVAVTGDATLSAAGVLTVATGAIEDSMIEGLAAGQIILGVDGTAANNLKAVLSGDVTMSATGAVTIGAGKVTAANLAVAVQDELPYVTVTPVDGTNATATVTIQVKDAAGNDLDEKCLLRVWNGTASGGAPVACSVSLVASTGLEIHEHLSEADYDFITDANGVLVLVLSNAAGTYYLMVEVNGTVTITEITITGTA